MFIYYGFEVVFNNLGYYLAYTITEGDGPIIIECLRGISLGNKSYKCGVESIIHPPTSPALFNYLEELLSN